jgi:hypothetical protein
MPVQRSEIGIASVYHSELIPSERDGVSVSLGIVGGSRPFARRSENRPTRKAASFGLWVPTVDREFVTANGADARGIMGHSDLLWSLTPTDASNIASAFSFPHYTTGLAQNGTPVLTEEGTDEPNPLAAPTPEVVPVPTAPGIPAIPPALYSTVINRLVDFILLLVGFGGGYVLIKAWKNPEQGKQLITFGLAVLEFGTKLTPTAADDTAIKRLADALAPIIAPAVEGTVKAVIADERAKLVVQTGNKVEALNFAPPPPQNPVS